MNPEQAKAAIVHMNQEAQLNGDRCPRCGCSIAEPHKANCAWGGRYDELSKMLIGPLQGPNLRWGDPCGTYEIEIVAGGALLFYRQIQRGGGMLEIKIPFTTTALAEMQALLNMLEFPFKVEVPNGRIAGSC